MSEPPTQAILTDSLAAFRPGHQRSDRRAGRAASFILTTAAHLGLLAAILFGVRVTAPIIIDAKPLAVSIEKQAQVPVPVLNMIPRMIPPQAIHVPAPEFTVLQEPSPVLATVAPSLSGDVAKGAAGPGAPTGCGSCYLVAIHNYLAAFMNYPREARDRHVQGVVIIHFVSDHAGNLISFEILKSSGQSILDEAALALMRQARKIPPVPADLNINGLSSNIPISYTYVPGSAAPSFSINRFSR